jgi:hypothetical protein
MRGYVKGYLEKNNIKDINSIQNIMQAGMYAKNLDTKIIEVADPNLLGTPGYDDIDSIYIVPTKDGKFIKYTLNRVLSLNGSIQYEINEFGVTDINTERQALAQIYLQKLQERLRNLDENDEKYISVNGVETLVNSVKSEGAKVIIDYPYKKEFGIRDSDRLSDILKGGSE